MASSLLSAITFNRLISNRWRAARYSPHFAMSGGLAGLFHCSAREGGKIRPTSGEVWISARLLMGEAGLRASHSRRASSAVGTSAARLASNSFRLGIVIASYRTDL